MQKNYEGRLFLHSIENNLVVLSDSASVARRRYIPVSMIVSMIPLGEPRTVWVVMEEGTAALFGFTTPAPAPIVDGASAKPSANGGFHIADDSHVAKSPNALQTTASTSEKAKATLRAMEQKGEPTKTQPLRILDRIARSNESIDSDFPGLMEAVQVAVANETGRQFHGITNVIYSIRDELREIAKNGIRV